jgi:hypothetical protein
LQNDFTKIRNDFCEFCSFVKLPKLRKKQVFTKHKNRKNMKMFHKTETICTMWGGESKEKEKGGKTR